MRTVPLLATIVLVIWSVVSLLNPNKKISTPWKHLILYSVLFKELLGVKLNNHSLVKMSIPLSNANYDYGYVIYIY